MNKLIQYVFAFLAAVMTFGTNKPVLPTALSLSEYRCQNVGIRQANKNWQAGVRRLERGEYLKALSMSKCDTKGWEWVRLPEEDRAA